MRAICCQAERVGVGGDQVLHLLTVWAEHSDAVLVVLSAPAGGALHPNMACVETHDVHTVIPKYLHGNAPCVLGNGAFPMVQYVKLSRDLEFATHSLYSDWIEAGSCKY